MLTLRRFKVLTESYGADLGRWPPEARDQAEQFLQSSGAARALFQEARRLDEAIVSHSARQHGLRWPAGAEEQALGRLRAAVAARIAASPAVREPRVFGWLPGVRQHVGLVTGGALAVVAGLLIGTMYGPPSAPVGPLAALLQPAALDFLAD